MIDSEAIYGVVELQPCSNDCVIVKYTGKREGIVLCHIQLKVNFFYIGWCEWKLHSKKEGKHINKKSEDKDALAYTCTFELYLHMHGWARQASHLLDSIVSSLLALISSEYVDLSGTPPGLYTQDELECLWQQN